MAERDTARMILNSALKVNEEKRKSTRIPLCAKVKMLIDGQLIEGELVNISLNGAFVTSDATIETDSLVIITIFDTSTTRIISDVKARVVRVAGNGVGLQFE
jgi:hypothetical protein